MTFQQDIESKHLNIYPLVRILLHDNTELYLSTRRERMLISSPDYGGGDIELPIRPILLNIPSISESIDIETKKYKISSVTLSVSDYELDGEKFSDILIDSGNNSIINTEVYIYYVSQSRKYFYSGLTDPTPMIVGRYIIRDYKQTESQVSIVCEDRSQAELHKDLPTNYIFDSTHISGRKDNERLIPMVFGNVINSPSVKKKYTADRIDIDEGMSEGADYEVIFDSETVFFIHPSDPLRIYDTSKDLYYKAHQNQAFNLYEAGQNDSLHNIWPNYTTIGGTAYIESRIQKELNDSDPPYYNRNLVYDGLIQCSYQGQVKELRITDKDVFDHVSTSELNSDFSLQGYLYSVFDFDGSNYQALDVKIIFETPSGMDKDLVFISASSNISLGVNSFGVQARIDSTDGFGAHQDEVVENYTEATMGFQYFALGLNHITGFTNKDLVNYITFGLKFIQLPDSPYAYIAASTQEPISLNYFFNTKFENRHFFADIQGREANDPSTERIITNILTNELNVADIFVSTYDGPDWKFDFTIDKKINSKKLIEEILQCTPYFGYFKDDVFNLISINNSYSSSDKIISADDVIDYSCRRTSINDVITRVKVKYHYDYALKDCIKETEWIFAANELGSNYDLNYYGFDNDNAPELEFKAKYIQDLATAELLAHYLLFSRANQHNIFKIKVGLSYANYKIGDICQFDKLILGKKVFGENYLYHQNRNGQVVLKFFILTSVKKTLEYIELGLYQLHEMEAFDGIYGCTDENAENFNPDATDEDGSCTYGVMGFCDLNAEGQYDNSNVSGNWSPVNCTQAGGTWTENEPIYGCMNQDAVNYDSTANINDNSCVIFPTLGEMGPVDVVVSGEIGAGDHLVFTVVLPDNWNYQYSPEAGETYDGTPRIKIAFIPQGGDLTHVYLDDILTSSIDHVIVMNDSLAVNLNPTDLLGTGQTLQENIQHIILFSVTHDQILSASGNNEVTSTPAFFEFDLDIPEEPEFEFTSGNPYDFTLATLPSSDGQSALRFKMSGNLEDLNMNEDASWISIILRYEEIGITAEGEGAVIPSEYLPLSSESSGDNWGPGYAMCLLCKIRIESKVAITDGYEYTFISDEIFGIQQLKAVQIGYEVIIGAEEGSWHYLGPADTGFAELGDPIKIDILGYDVSDLPGYHESSLYGEENIVTPLQIMDTWNSTNVNLNTPAIKWPATIMIARYLKIEGTEGEPHYTSPGNGWVMNLNPIPTQNWINIGDTYNLLPAMDFGSYDYNQSGGVNNLDTVILSMIQARWQMVIAALEGSVEVSAEHLPMLDYINDTYPLAPVEITTDFIISVGVSIVNEYDFANGIYDQYYSPLIEQTAEGYFNFYKPIFDQLDLVGNVPSGKVCYQDTVDLILYINHNI